MITVSRRNLLQFAAVGAAATALAGCAQTTTSSSSGSDSGDALTVGTTDKVVSIDPAGQYDNGSFNVIIQVFPFLLNSTPGASDTTPSPDIAESAEFTADTEYTVKLKDGLTFANGNSITAEDVKFSFDRVVNINDKNGPSSLLANLDSVEVADDLTAVFHLKVVNDQTFPQVLTSPAGAIVDHQTFSADSIMSDDDVVSANAFAGPFVISSYTKNQLVSFSPNADYQGMLPTASSSVNLRYYASSDNLKLDIQQSNIDVATRSLTATDVESLSNDDSVVVHEGPGGEMRMMVFNLNTMPYGAATGEADEAKALAVRQAVAHLIDREAISNDVYKNTYEPAYGYVPDGFLGTATPFTTLYGDGNGGPSTDRAASTLSDADVETPVTLNLQYNPDHYGQSSGDEYAAIKAQLEASGLFTVNLQSTEWNQYSTDRVNDVYPVFQLGWFPDYSDADNYLTPFFSADNFVYQHFDDADIQDKIVQQATEPDRSARESLIEEIQDDVAQLVPIIPLFLGKQIAVSTTDVQGVDTTLDASYKVRYDVMSK